MKKSKTFNIVFMTLALILGIAWAIGLYWAYRNGGILFGIVALVWYPLWLSSFGDEKDE